LFSGRDRRGGNNRVARGEFGNADSGMMMEMEKRLEKMLLVAEAIVC